MVIGVRCARTARDIFISGEWYINEKVKEYAARERGCTETTAAYGVNLSSIRFPLCGMCSAFAYLRRYTCFQFNQPRCNALSIISVHSGAMFGFLYRVTTATCISSLLYDRIPDSVYANVCSDWKQGRETKPKGP